MTAKKRKPLTDMTLEELEEYGEELEGQKAELAEERRRVAGRRAELVAEDSASAWGLTPEAYARCKKTATEEKAPLQKVLNRARAELGRQLLESQRARAGAVDVEKRAKEA
jgi:hypothetical protein